MKGRVLINLTHKKDGFVKCFSAEITQIIKLAIERNWLPSSRSSLEVKLIDGCEIVKSKLEGKCQFRLGVEQHVIIEENKI